MQKNDYFVSTVCLPWEESVESRVFLYSNNGITKIEFGANVTVNSGLEFLSNYDAQFLIHNYFPPPQDSFVLNLASKNENIRNRSIDFVLNALDLSEKISAPFYSVHSGFITDPTSFGKTSFNFPSPDSQTAVFESWNYFYSALGLVLEHARKKDINILVENNVCTVDLIGKLILVKQEEFQELFKIMSHPNLGILLDTGHLNVSACTMGFNKIEFVERIAPYVQAIHIHDNMGIDDTHEPVVEGSWILDVLAHPNLFEATKIIESRFDNIEELRNYYDWLRMKTI